MPLWPTGETWRTEPSSDPTLPPSVHQPTSRQLRTRSAAVVTATSEGSIVDHRVAVAQARARPHQDVEWTVVDRFRGGCGPVRPRLVAEHPWTDAGSTNTPRPGMERQLTQRAFRLGSNGDGVFRGDRCCRPDGRSRRRRLDPDDCEGGGCDRLRRGDPASTGVMGVVSHGFTRTTPRKTPTVRTTNHTRPRAEPLIGRGSRSYPVSIPGLYAPMSVSGLRGPARGRTSDAGVSQIARSAVDVGWSDATKWPVHVGVVARLPATEEAEDLEQEQQRHEPTWQEPQEQVAKHVATMALLPAPW